MASPEAVLGPIYPSWAPFWRPKCCPASSLKELSWCQIRWGTAASVTRRIREPNFGPEAWLGPCRLATTKPARPRGAGAESRSFERCAPTTSCRDPTPASTTPLPAHGPCTARIRTSATAMRTRCGEGDLVGGWHAGASPFTPITRWVTNRGSSSASLAHTYTPLGRSQRL